MSDIRTCAAIPMREGDKVIGVFALESKDEDAFTPEDIQIIEAVVSQVPIATRNAELLVNLRNSNIDLKRAKDELEEINKKLKESYWMEAMGESVGAVVHRMAHYASPIKSAADVALRYLQINPSEENMSRAINNLIELQGYGQDLQKFIQKFNQANAAINKERFNLDSLIEDIVNNFPQDIPMETRISQRQEIITDKFKLQLILECLIDNALNAVRSAISMDGGRAALVVINLERVGECYRIEVSDSGMGIPPELQVRLLRHIVQSQSKDGNGSGLFISQRLVTRLNGTIEFKSSLEGSVFSLTMPSALIDEDSND